MNLVCADHDSIKQFIIIYEKDDGCPLCNAETLIRDLKKERDEFRDLAITESNKNKNNFNIFLFDLTQSEREVVKLLYCIKYHINTSIKITKKDGSYTKRHSKAIDRLKKIGIIYRDTEYILRLNMRKEVSL